jgi:hypothetical protein
VPAAYQCSSLLLDDPMYTRSTPSPLLLHVCWLMPGSFDVFGLAYHNYMCASHHIFICISSLYCINMMIFYI